MNHLLTFKKRITLPEWEFDIVVATILLIGLIAGSLATLSGVIPSIFADTPTSITLTSDTSYSQGTLSNVEISGTGSNGSIRLSGSAGPENTLYRKKLTFDNSSQLEDLSDFPVLVVLTNSNFDFSKIQSDGDDIRFTDSDGSTLLSYDIESFDSDDEEAYIWVKVPQVNQSSDTDFIYMYYGNDSLPSGESPSEVWDEDYSMVYHLNDSSGTSGIDSVTDSTGNTAGTPSAGISFGETGKIGYSTDFSSGTGITLGSLGAPLLTDDVTISFWMNVNNYSSPNRQNPFEQAYGGWGTMTLETNSRISWFFGSHGANASPYGSHQSNNIAENGNWVYVTAVRNGTANTYSWYKNGEFIGGGSFSPSYPNIQSRPFILGDGYVFPLNGKLDEFRISNQVRSADWIAASYLVDTNAFITYGTEETTIQTAGSWESATNGNAIDLVWNGGWGDGSNASSTGFSADISNVTASSTITFKIRTAESAAQLSSATYQTIGTANSGTTYIVTKDDLDGLGLPIDSAGKYAQIRVEFSQSNGLNPTLNSLTLFYSGDDTGPESNASTLLMKNVNGGESINENEWVSSNQPYFSWTGGGDTQAGLKGYCLYIGTDSDGDPATSKGLLGTSPVALNGSTCGFIVNSTNIDLATTSYRGSTWLTSSADMYYFSIKAIDNANNVSPTAESFSFKFDNTPPTNPSGLSAPQGFLRNIESFTIAWATTGSSAAVDDHSGVKGYQYKIGDSGNWQGVNHSGTEDCEDVLTSSPYVLDSDYDSLGTGENTFYLRTVDTACNISSSSITAILKYNADAPSAPQNLSVTPEVNTTNSFAFTWQKPEQFQGNESGMSYCYTVNALPTQSNCTFTNSTSLLADSYATQPGDNLFYVVAKDEAGNINFGDYISIKFTANTPAPGIARNLDVADISVKTTENWRLAIAWDEPSNIGAGITKYDIYRSTAESSCSTVFSSFSLIGSTAGLTYSDSGLNQQDYYYCVRACDSANNCSAVSSTVSGFPDGKFTEPADIISEPNASSITTKKATISWVTGRSSDSKIAFGTETGSYFEEEPSNSTQLTNHQITLNNLSPGTVYYYVAKWTDEDGNTGISDEYSFTTNPPPVLQEVTVPTINLDSASIQFTSTNAVEARIYYGLNINFGGVEEVATSPIETTYTVPIGNLVDGSKYLYKIYLVDPEGEEYEGDINSFTTLPQPRLSNVRLQQVTGTAQPSVLVTWDSNTDVSSIVRYYPENNPSSAQDNVNVERTSGQHRALINGLLPETTYNLFVRGQDRLGNEAVSDLQRFTTATDTRPPALSNIQVNSTIVKNEAGENSAQISVSWDTDEPTSSQVEFGEGTGTTYAQSTQEDSNLTFNHLVIISGLSPSKVYHLRAISKDSARNIGVSIDTVTITPKATDNALDLVIRNLQQIFGFLIN